MERTTNDGFAPLRDGRGRGRRRGGGARAPRGAARRARRRRRAPDDVRRLPVRPRRVRPLPRDGPERRAMEAGERGSPRLFATMGALASLPARRVRRHVVAAGRRRARDRALTLRRDRVLDGRAVGPLEGAAASREDRGRGDLVVVSHREGRREVARAVGHDPGSVRLLGRVVARVRRRARGVGRRVARYGVRGPEVARPRLSPPPPPPPRRRRRRRRRRDGPAPRRRRGLSFGRGERRGRRRRTQTPLEEEGQGEHAGRAAETVLPGPPHLVRRVRVSRPIRDRRRVRRVLYTGPHTTAFAW